VATQIEAQKRLILWTIWMVVLTGILLWCAYLVSNVLLLIYISGVLAIGFSPIVRLIQKQKMLPVGTRRLPRWLAILVLYLAIIGAVIGVAFMVFPPLVEQARQLWSAAPGMLERGQSFLLEKGLLRAPLQWRDVVEQAPVGGGSDAVGTVFGAVAGVLGGLFGLLTILILTFYLLVESEGLHNTFLHLFPSRDRQRVADMSSEITVKVSAWLGGQLLLGTIIGITSALGLWLLGVPYFYVLALISAIGELIPVVGPLLAAIPAVAVASTVSLQKALLVILFFVVQQQVENHVLVPKIMQRQVGISPVVVILALLIGGQLLGILGAILAVPTAAILQVVISELWSQERK
jgi:predicted PurR-regulated permease PerM